MNNKISKFFFTIFIFLLPWQTRLILFPEKPELFGFSIYLSEIFLWLALAFWLTSVDFKKIRVPHVLMLLCFYVLVSISWSEDKIAAFRIWLYIFEGIMIYLYLKNQKEVRETAIYIFLSSLFVVSLFGIWQFFNLGSPAEKWFGLAVRGAWNLGDIVVQADGMRFLRAYGPFPHPNIFGGYLVGGIMMLFWSIISKPNLLRSLQVWKYVFGGVFFFALFLTFSRSAWLALALASIYFFIKNPRKDVLKFFIFLSALAVALSIIFWPLLRTRATSAGRLEQKSNTERIASWKDGVITWSQNPIFGSGLGDYSTTIGYQVTASKLVPDSVQPAHNIFILILSQLGLAGFLIYLFVWKNFWKNPIARPLLIAFFVIGIFDHYLWTLWSGQMLFWVGIALTVCHDYDNL